MEKIIDILIVGAGNRGMYVYGNLIKKKNLPMRVTGIAEPDKEKREKMAAEHNVSKDFLFETGLEALSSDKKFDAVIIAAPDHRHYELSNIALRKGIHVLLEKPMSYKPEECVALVNQQKSSGSVLSLAHVLRYAPFFTEIKKMIQSGELGKILLVDLLEEVGYWHFAHSYVRGNWRNEATSGPIILTKSCHDLDILNFLIDSEVKFIFSSGSLHHFKKENAPKGSKNRCVEDCKIKDTCPYNAERFYLMEDDPQKVAWPAEVISLDKTVNSRKKAIEQGIYGKCVFQCDNNVCDNQTVLLAYKNDVRVNFRLTAFGQTPTRKIKIYFENGEINGNLTEGSIKITKYSGSKHKDILRQEKISYLGGHGGGDEFLLNNFAELIFSRNEKINLSSALHSLDSHLQAFAAEISRKNNCIVDYKEYKKSLGIN